MKDTDAFPPRARREEPFGTPATRRARELRLWGGRGGNSHCDGCHRPIGALDVDYEVEAELDGKTVTFHFHRVCYDRWKAVRQAESAREEACEELLLGA